jgi:CRP-like cAMP-binding protein
MNFADLFRHENEPLTFQEGDSIIEKGSESKTFYVILEGSVEIRYKEQLLATETAGGVFGELSLVDNAPASADVVATSPTRLAAISEARFQFLIQQHPFFAISVMKVMAERIRNMNRLG